MKMSLNVRLAFGQGVFEARQGEDGGEAKFQCKGLIDRNDPQVKKINDACDAVAKEKWADKAPAILKGLRAQDRTVIHDGDNKPNWEGFEGHWYVSASSKVRPTTVNAQAQPVAQADGTIYSGCYVKLLIELWAQDNKFGKRINATLRGVQFVRDGDAFSGGAAPADESEFDDLSVAENDI